MSAPIVLAKRPGGPERGWVYEAEPCPACIEGYRGDYPCGVCRGAGELFEDGYLDDDQLKALLLARAGREQELRDYAEMLTAAYMDELLRGREP